jgi:uncharacterized membrane protein
MTGIVERQKEQIKFLIGCSILLVVFVLLLAWFAVVAEQQLRAKDAVVNQDIEPKGFIYIDESAKTGFMTSERFDATFTGYDYPVALPEGSEPEFDSVYTITVYRYPSVEGIPYRVDSFDEAVEFLRELN